MNGSFGQAITKVSDKTNMVYLQLVPGESCLVQVFAGESNAPDYAYMKASGDKIALNSDWTLTFATGGPELPKPVKLKKLGSWTELDGSGCKAFSGTAVYKTNFSKPSANAFSWQLDLGKVAHSARIILNGREIASLISPPYIANIPVPELMEENTLEISVTNLMGNRIADMERKGQPYKIFYNVNFPAIKAENRAKGLGFTTMHWKPQTSGLLGPVTLTPLKPFK
jgi:hypothetical protein